MSNASHEALLGAELALQAGRVGARNLSRYAKSRLLSAAHSAVVCPPWWVLCTTRTRLQRKAVESVGPALFLFALVSNVGNNLRTPGLEFDPQPVV